LRLGQTMSILAEIFAHKREEIAASRQARPLQHLIREAQAAAPALDFVKALRSRPAPALIAEVKCASPSKGRFKIGFDPLQLAQTYQDSGAAAISVLTDRRYFQGDLEHLRQIADQLAAHPPRVPLLRKDFICDPYQVYEARLAGADAVLLIAAALDAGLLADLHALSRSLGMAALVEVHNHPELEKALRVEPQLLGINNRDLHDFSVRLETTLDLLAEIPSSVCRVSESGIRTPADVERLRQAGLDAILVGEALVTAPDVAATIRQLIQAPP
jgi:indole-3-glycerol phosphate synthase